MIEIGKQYLLKTKEQLIEEYGRCFDGTPNVPFGINNDMLRLLGTLVTVSKVYYNGKRLHLIEDAGIWVWSPDWFVIKTERGNTLN